MTPDTALNLLRLTITGGLNAPVGPIPFHPYHFSAYGLRDYQDRMLREAIGYMQAGVRRILLQLPTGGGKTRMAAAMQGSASSLGLSSEFLVHRKELINQTSETFTDCGIDHSFVAAGRPFDPEAAVRIAGIATLAKRFDLLPPPNLRVVDEAHHAAAATWAAVLNGDPEAFIIGLSATPERLDGRGMREHFDVMVRGPSPVELIRRGYLSEFDYYAPTTPDTSGLRDIGGDFNREQAAEIMDKPKLIGDVVEHYLRLASGQQGIVFAASREHSRRIAEAFRAEGIAAAHVDGTMDGERDRIVDAFRAGDIRVMTNVDLFGEGFDVPGIVYVGLARPTKSLALHRQQCGRALRVIPGKDVAIICDHAGNALRLNDLPDTERQWTLDGRVARARAGGADDAMSIRQCKACFRISPSIVTVCPGCGEEFPVQQRAALRQEDGKLSKVERDRLRAIEKEQRRLEREAAKAAAAEEKERQRRLRKKEERECETFDELQALAARRGYAENWARVRWRLRHGGFVR